MKTITLTVYTTWLRFLPCDYTILEPVSSDLVRIQVSADCAFELISMGIAIEKNRSRLKVAA